MEAVTSVARLIRKNKTLNLIRSRARSLKIPQTLTLARELRVKNPASIQLCK